MQGALSLNGANNVLQSNSFDNNSAAARGGAIMYTQQSLQTNYLKAPGGKEKCTSDMFFIFAPSEASEMAHRS